MRREKLAHILRAFIDRGLLDPMVVAERVETLEAPSSAVGAARASAFLSVDSTAGSDLEAASREDPGVSTRPDR